MNQQQRQEQDFIPIKAVAQRLGCSKDTIRRKFKRGELKSIEWVDFFNDGRLRASVESVDRFIAVRQQATQKVYTEPLQNSRP